MLRIARVPRLGLAQPSGTGRAALAGRDRRHHGLVPDPHPCRRGLGTARGPFGRWADGVTAMRADCIAFAGHWRAHNDRVLPAAEPARCGWCSATPPRRASARPARTAVTSARPSTGLRQRTGTALAGAQPVGLRRADPRRARRSAAPAGRPAARPCHLRDRVSTTSCSAGRASCSPTCAPCSRRSRTTRSCSTCRCPPASGGLGRMSVPYVTRINRVIHAGGGQRGACRSPRSPGTSCRRGPGSSPSDYFHPSQDGYRDWSRALLAAI